MRRLLLKVCGVRAPSTIEGLSELAPDFVGFIFVKSSPRYVGDTLSLHDLEQLPSKCRRIGVFQDEEISVIERTVSQYGLSGVQLHGSEECGYTEQLRARLPQATIIKAIGVHTKDSLEALSYRRAHPDLYLFDNLRGGSGEPFDHTLLSSYSVEIPFLLAGGIGLEQIETVAALARKHPLLAGIDINSRVEITPGEKDLGAIREIQRRLAL